MRFRWEWFAVGIGLGALLNLVVACVTVQTGTGVATEAKYSDTPTFKSVILESRDNPNVKWRIVLVSTCYQDMLCVDEGTDANPRPCTPKECTHIEFEEVGVPPKSGAITIDEELEFFPGFDHGADDGKTEYSLRSEP